MAIEDPTKKLIVNSGDKQALELYESVDKELRMANANDIAFSMVLEQLPRIDLGDAREVAERRDLYFEKCIHYGKKPNLAGYALALGKSVKGLQDELMTRRSSLDALEEIYKGISMIENILVSEMSEGRVQTVAGIFLLKNHFNYKDQAEVALKNITPRTDTKAIENKYKSIVEI